MNGKTHGWPAAGPLDVVHVVLLLAVVVLVVVVVVVLVVVVEVVVVDVVVVLTVVVVEEVEEVVVVVVVDVVVVVVEALTEGQELGQKPYLLLIKLPPASTSVAHQAADRSTLVHCE